MTAQEKIVQWLFATQAIRVSPADQPFWYASGTLGPFYVNTHFLFGSEGEANRLLGRIEQYLPTPLDLPAVIAADVNAQYEANSIYHELCDLMVDELQDLTCDFVSGGERRDYFFSFQAARMLAKPHLSLLKDGRAYLSDQSFSETHEVKAGELTGMKALHVVDLVTEASSYQRAWLPALRRCGATLPTSLAIVDRRQGGGEYLASEGTRLVCLAAIDQALFQSALAASLITRDQYEQIVHFQENPQAYMEQFIRHHPDFLADQVKLGGKNRDRALIYLEKHPEVSGKA